MQRSPLFLTSFEYSIRLGRQTRIIPHSLRPCRETRPCDLILQTNPSKPTASSLPIYDKTTDPFLIGKVPWSFTNKRRIEKNPSEGQFNLFIIFLRLFRQHVLSVRRRALSFLKSSLSLIFLLFLAGQFFSPPFAFIQSGTFWQDPPPYSQKKYITKKERFSILFVKSVLLCAFSLPTHATS